MGTLKDFDFDFISEIRNLVHPSLARRLGKVSLYVIHICLIPKSNKAMLS